MTATKKTGTAQDWIENIETNHYLSVASSGFNGDNDNYTVYWDDPYNTADEVALHINYTNQTADAAAGENGDDFNLISFSGDRHFIQRDVSWANKSDSVTWWWDAGSDWFWSVAHNTTRDNIIYIAHQTVNQLWSYHLTYETARVATFGQGSGWNMVSTIDGSGSNAGKQKVATLTENNDWLLAGPTVIQQQVDGTSLVGTVDAWGEDIADSTPQHLDTITCGSTTYQYFAPGTSDPQWFFKLS